MHFVENYSKIMNMRFQKIIYFENVLKLQISKKKIYIIQNVLILNSYCLNRYRYYHGFTFMFYT